MTRYRVRVYSYDTPPNMHPATAMKQSDPIIVKYSIVYHDGKEARPLVLYCRPRGSSKQESLIFVLTLITPVSSNYGSLRWTRNTRQILERNKTWTKRKSRSAIWLPIPSELWSFPSDYVNFTSPLEITPHERDDDTPHVNQWRDSVAIGRWWVGRDCGQRSCKT